MSISQAMRRYIEYYDSNSNKVGIYEADKKEPLAPIYHCVSSSCNVVVSIDYNSGDIVGAVKLYKMNAKASEKEFVIMPNRYNNRTSGIKPQPLCDKVKYLDNNNGDCYNEYIRELSEWNNSAYTHAIVDAVYRCLSNHSVVSDCAGFGVELTDDDWIRWTVYNLPDGGCSDSWRNVELFNAYIEYCRNVYYADSKVVSELTLGDDYARDSQTFSAQVFRGVSACVVQDSDSSDITRCRYGKSEYSNFTFGMEANYKAHNVMRYMFANFGFNCDKYRYLIYGAPYTESYFGKSVVMPSKSYREETMEIIMRGKNKINDKVVLDKVAYFPSSNGRVSMITHEEFDMKEYLDNIVSWRNEFCVEYNVKDGETKTYHPSIVDTMKYAYGDMVDGEFKLYNESKYSKLYDRMFNAIVYGGRIPQDVVDAICKNVDKMHLINTDKHPYEKKRFWRTVLSAINKYYYDMYEGDKETMNTSIKESRDYQYGRIMAAIHHAEVSLKKGRGTTVMKNINRIRKNPMFVLQDIYTDLMHHYVDKINGVELKRMSNIIADATAVISELSVDEIDKPLGPAWMLAFDAQIKAIEQDIAERSESKKEKADSDDVDSVESTPDEYASNGKPNVSII